MNDRNNHLKIIVGLGKTGLSCIRYLAKNNFKIKVVDSRPNPPGLKELKQNFPDIPVCLGEFDFEVLSQAEDLIVSPGVSLHEPAIAKCIERGIKTFGDIELFARHAQAPVIAITGSNGKSTVTSLVGMMAEIAGKKVKVGGNLGMPALDLLDPNTELYVLELSSFQLETTSSLKPLAATVLNISQDHMDRYKSFREYLTAKQRIYNGCQFAVINRDDPLAYKGAPLFENIISFGTEPSADNFGIIQNNLCYGADKLISIDDLKIKGLHNVVNSLAALALGKAAGLPQIAMIKALREFRGLPHRCQLVATIKNVSWYNDSKGTNVGATKASIEGLGKENKGRIVLILGGIGKGADFTKLKNTITKHIRTVVLIGKDATLIKRALPNSCKTITAGSMEEAVKTCAKEAVDSDIVLLSPACASFDMFDNFEHRGNVFIKEVNALL